MAILVMGLADLWGITDLHRQKVPKGSKTQTMPLVGGQWFESDQCTEVRLPSFLSGGFTTMAVLNDRKENFQNPPLCNGRFEFFSHLWLNWETPGICQAANVEGRDFDKEISA